MLKFSEYLVLLPPQVVQRDVLHHIDLAQLRYKNLLEHINEIAMVLVVHGVVMVEVQEDDLFAVCVQEGIDVIESVSHSEPKQAVDEVDFVACFSRFRRNSEVKVTNATFQLLPEGQILSHGPFLHQFFGQQTEHKR